MSRRSINVAALTFCLIIAGCGGDQSANSDGGTGGYSDGTGTGKPNPPQVVAPPASVCSASVPIHGTAASGVTIYALGGKETPAPVEAVNGQFCIDVTLKPNASNTIEVRAHHSVYGDSDPTTVVVKQSGTCSTSNPTDQTKPVNVALGIVPDNVSDITVTPTNTALITDDKQETVVSFSKYQLSTGDANIWVRVNLGKLIDISKVVVRWQNATTTDAVGYASNFYVLTSAKTDPGNPDLDNGLWNKAATITDGTGGDYTVSMPTNTIAQHVALWMNHESGGFGTHPEFKIGEFQVWDRPEDTTTPVTTNTCASGGY